MGRSQQIKAACQMFEKEQSLKNRKQLVKCFKLYNISFLHCDTHKFSVKFPFFNSDTNFLLNSLYFVCSLSQMIKICLVTKTFGGSGGLLQSSCEFLQQNLQNPLFHFGCTSSGNSWKNQESVFVMQRKMNSVSKLNYKDAQRIQRNGKMSRFVAQRIDFLRQLALL